VNAYSDSLLFLNGDGTVGGSVYGFGASAPIFYPLAAVGAPGSSNAVFADLSASNRTVTYRLADGTPLLSTYPGQAKIAPGAFAHYGPDGVTLIPLSDAPTPPPTVTSYSLSAGSQIVKGCALCGVVPVPTPVAGSFDLRLIESNSLFASYKVDNLALQSIDTNGTQYQVAGNGYYQVSAAGARDFVLSIAVMRDGVQDSAILTNYDSTIQQAWPAIQAGLIQTNVVSGQQYRLSLSAAPTSSTFTIQMETQSGNIRLDWTLAGSQFQVERAAALQGPYVPFSPVITDRFYEDVGARTNGAAAFYRVRQIQ
jgi:hypothetical protein